MKKGFLFNATSIIIAIALTSCSSVPTPSLSLAQTQRNQTVPVASAIHHTALWEGDPATTWNRLQHSSSKELIAMKTQTNDPIKAAWLELALISKRHSLNTPELARQLIAWRTSYPTHPANQLLPDNTVLDDLQNESQPHQIAILLPQRGVYASAARTVREGFLYSYYSNLSKLRKLQNIKFYDTTRAENMAALYQRAVAEGADFVIGPLVKENVQQLRRVGFFNSPTLALNYSDNQTTSLPPNFYEFGLLPEDETQQIAERAHLAGKEHALIIAPQNAWGKRLVSAFTTHWQSIGGSVQQAWSFTPTTDFNQSVAELVKRHDFDVIFLFSQPQEAQRIVPLLHNFANNIPIYATSAIHSNKADLEKNVLNGVIVCDIPWNMKAAQRNEITSDRLYAVGQDAYLLSQVSKRLEKLPNFPIYGTTGALTLLTNHQIHRRIPCKPIQNGAP